MKLQLLKTAPRKYVFVFGSNEGGFHGAGAAQTAAEKYGAVMGKCYGHYGDSFAIPTKDDRIITMPVEAIKPYVDGFLAYAKAKRKVNFMVTAIGTGLAGIAPWKMAALFLEATSNCWFDEQWKQYLGDEYNYWGTY